MAVNMFLFRIQLLEFFQFLSYPMLSTRPPYHLPKTLYLIAFADSLMPERQMGIPRRLLNSATHYQIFY